jgi:fructose-1-phosphate kinase PfkB-like protein
MKKIVVIGSSNVDTTLHVKDFPKPGETINALDITTAGGGKGANQAIAAAKSGAETYFINRVGEDSEGNFITQLMRFLKNYCNILISLHRMKLKVPRSLELQLKIIQRWPLMQKNYTCLV